jgi:RNA polymerase sigma factor (sigma-70 family)
MTTRFRFAVAQAVGGRCLPGEMDVMPHERSPTGDEATEEVATAWRAHAPSALRFATALVGPADAHAVATTAFLRVVRQPNWNECKQLERYLLRAVRNEAQNLYRERRRRWERDLLAIGPVSVLDKAPDVDLLRAVAALSVQQRAVVFLTYWHDMTEAEVAETLAIGRSTVHRTLLRARIALRKALR